MHNNEKMNSNEAKQEINEFIEKSMLSEITVEGIKSFLESQSISFSAFAEQLANFGVSTNHLNEAYLKEHKSSHEMYLNLLNEHLSFLREQIKQSSGDKDDIYKMIKQILEIMQEERNKYREEMRLAKEEDGRNTRFMAGLLAGGLALGVGGIALLVTRNPKKAAETATTVVENFLKIK